MQCVSLIASRPRMSLAVATLATALMGSTARAELIDVQFNSNGGSSAQGIAGSVFTGPAFVGSAGDAWNQFSQSYDTATLLDTGSNATGISFSYSGTVVYGLLDGAQYQPFYGTPYANLMQSFLVSHANESPINLSFTGLTPGESFSLYLYGSSQSPNYGEEATVNGITQTAQQSGASTLIEGNDYLVFNGVADTSGDIFATISTPSGLSEADLNGLQLVTDVPEPVSISLFGVGLAGLIAARRRRAA